MNDVWEIIANKFSRRTFWYMAIGNDMHQYVPDKGSKKWVLAGLTARGRWPWSD
jgi:hypothetical protein